MLDSLFIGCIADDFTGGSDAASFLRKAGLRTINPSERESWSSFVRSFRPRSFAASAPASPLPKAGLIYCLPLLRVVLGTGVQVKLPGVAPCQFCADRAGGRNPGPSQSTRRCSRLPSVLLSLFCRLGSMP